MSSLAIFGAVTQHSRDSEALPSNDPDWILLARRIFWGCTVPQLNLPLFPAGAARISDNLSVATEDGRVTYFNGVMPVFVHDENDVRTFQMITSQFCCNGNAKQADIVRAFGVTPISVKRSVKRYREKGVAGFYAKRESRGPAVLTPSVLSEAQQLFDDGLEAREVAEKLGLKLNTLAKAVRASRLHVAKKKIRHRPPMPRR